MLCLPPPPGAREHKSAVYAAPQRLPCAQSEAVAAEKRTVWKETDYTDTPTEFRPEGFEPTWCSYFHLLL